MNRGIHYFLPEYFTLFLFGDGESKILKFPPAFSRSVENTIVHYVLIVVDILQKEEIPKKSSGIIIITIKKKNKNVRAVKMLTWIY